MNQRKDMALNNTKGLLFVQKGKQQKQRDFLRDKKSSKREEISSKRLSSHFERGRNDINIMPANRPANTNNNSPARICGSRQRSRPENNRSLYKVT